MIKYLSLLSLLLLFSCAHGKKEVSYRIGEKEFKGYIAHAKNVEGKRPGIIVVHEWWGQNEFARAQADKLAQMGYTAMAIDMYGEGKTTTHPSEAGEFAKSVYTNMDEATKRFDKALEVLKSQPDVDPEKIGAIGFCFGGSVVLSMARLGKDLDAVVSLHGGLQLPVKAKRGTFNGKVLVLTGEADPMVPAKDVKQFKRDMRRAKIDTEVIGYAGALHAYTNPNADNVAKEYKLPLGYDAKATADSWERMTKLFKEVF